MSHAKENDFLITETERCKEVIGSFEHDGFIAVDTEFHRRDTYHAKLSLIQVASTTHSFVFDVLAIEDLTPLISLLKDTTIIKIFHASRQDLEIFYHQYHFLPAPLFDTQVAAAALGLGEQVSYDAVVRYFLKTELDKSQQETNWLHRPLTQRQIDYARADVVHLVQIYPLLIKQLQQKNRLEWINDEITHLLNQSIYHIDPLAYWKKLCPKGWKTEARVTLYKLCRFREEYAARFNIPRGHVLKDDVLIDIARTSKKTLKINKLFKHFPEEERKHIGEIFVEYWNEIFDEDFIALLQGAEGKPVYLSNDQEYVLDILKLILKQTTHRLGTTAKILLGKDDLRRFVAQYPLHQDFDILTGWRFHEIGEMMCNILGGRIILTVKNGKIEILPNITE